MSTSAALQLARSSEAPAKRGHSARLDGTRISERVGTGPTRSLPDAGESVRSGESTGASRRWEREARAAGKAKYLPKHVRVCAQNPQRLAGERWTLALWKRGREADQTRIAYTCGSYRCPSPECQRAAAHRDYAKIAEGIARAGADGWNFLVLTLDRHGTAGGKAWPDEQAAFKALSSMSRNFLARIKRWHKRRGWGWDSSQWCATVEVHAGGWPHLNLMLRSPALARHLARQSDRLRAAGAPPAVLTRLRGELRAAALGTGWGPVGYAAPAASTPERLAGYLVKVGARMERQIGEVSKLCQAPTNARMKLRRIRAGKGFIQPLKKNPEWTGIMLRRQITQGVPELDERGRVIKRARARAVVSTLMQPDQVSQPPELVPGYCEGARIAMAGELAQATAELEHPERGERMKTSTSEQTPPEALAKLPAPFGVDIAKVFRLTPSVSRETLGAGQHDRKGNIDNVRQIKRSLAGGSAGEEARHGDRDARGRSPHGRGFARGSGNDGPSEYLGRG